MNSTKYAGADRGTADYGWLKANYSFSFSNYYDPKKTHFGKLRVLNDDIISAGAGFGTHPHANMEIITIPLKGAIAHKDSSGGEGVIRPNEVQLMSAGTGVEHSEVNHIKNGETNLLQIWILPNEQNVEPRYQQQFFDAHQRDNQWQYVVSNKHASALNIYQDAIIARTTLKSGTSIDYNVSYEGNGVFVFLIDGVIKIGDESIKKRDAIGINESENINIFAEEISELLVIEVPMN